MEVAFVTMMMMGAQTVLTSILAPDPPELPELAEFGQDTNAETAREERRRTNTRLAAPTPHGGNVRLGGAQHSGPSHETRLM